MNIAWLGTRDGSGIVKRRAGLRGEVDAAGLQLLVVLHLVVLARVGVVQFVRVRSDLTWRFSYAALG